MRQSVALLFGWPTIGLVVRYVCQSVRRSVNPTDNRFLNQSVGLSFRSVETDWQYETFRRFVGLSVDCSVGRLTNQFGRPSVDRSVGDQSFERPVSRLFDRLIGRSAD